MGLETVREEILGSAKEKASSIISDSRREANRIAKEAEKKAQELSEKSDAETKRIIDMVKRQELASAELENKKMALDAKKQMIEMVFAEARKRLESLDEKKREDYTKKLLEKAKNEIEVAYVHCSKKDAKFLKGINAETAEIIGGLMAENKERTVRVDYGFETLLESIKNSELQNINKILFA